MIVYISIGNSDDKLSQMEWGKFYRKTDLIIQGYRHQGLEIHGRWVSQSADYWQNACWCVETNPMGATLINLLKNQLRDVAADFNQDSIAWAEATTQFLTPPESQ